MGFRFIDNEWSRYIYIYISPYIYLLITTSVCPIYMFKPYKTKHFLKPLLEGVHLEKSEFDLVHFPGISGHFRLVLYKSGLIFCFGHQGASLFCNPKSKWVMREITVKAGGWKVTNGSKYARLGMSWNFVPLNSIFISWLQFASRASRGPAKT